jgi:NAD(P)H-dependent flavin oxidoreductase YrpB (nitropropane dioxygenase family)
MKVFSLTALLSLFPLASAFSVPSIIQGGMGVRISSYELARTVSKQGELGVISGTAVDTVMVRTLQNGKHIER